MARARGAGMVRALAIGVVVGAFGWPWCQVPLPQAVGLAVGAGLLGGLAPGLRLRLLAFGVAGLGLGAGLVARLEPGPELVGEVRVRGVVTTAGEGRRADVTLVAAGLPGEPHRAASGRMRLIFPERPPPAGVAVIAAGRARRIDPTRLPGEPDPIASAARAAVRSELVVSQWVRVGQDRPDPDLSASRHAPLLRALVNGDASDVAPEEAALLKRTGTWHLVSISGLHVGLGAWLGWWAAWLATRPLVVLRWRGLRWVCALGGVMGAVGYAELADWAVPARRAVWMCAAGLVAVAAARRPEVGRTLAVAALGTVAAEPSSVGSMGFQLSFGAMLGMLVVGPRVMRWVPPDSGRIMRFAAESLAASVGATLGTLPVMALQIQSVSWLSPLANLWAVPFIGTLATPLTVLAAGLGGTPKLLALAFADAAVDVGLWGLRRLDVAPSAPAVGSLGALALAAGLLLWRRELLAAVFTLAALTLRPARPQELVVTFLAVGQGDATLVEWPDGRRWLVDGGPPGQDLLRHLRARGIRSLDTVFVSHLHPDHFGGLLPVLEALPVKVLVARNLLPEIPMHNVETWTTRHPALVPLPEGYHSNEENNRSLVVTLSFGERRFLLPGDAEAEEEEALAAEWGEWLGADVLKVGHHGSRTSSTAAWLSAVRPELAVIPCGFDNRYGHPHAQALARWADTSPDTRMYRTDVDGSVEVRTNGRSLEVSRLGEPARWRLR